MIISSILDLFKGLLQIVFGFINLPAFPEGFTSAINTVLDIIFGSLNLLAFFIRPTTIKIAIPVLIILINFDELYKLTIFILKKIPFFNLS